MGRHRFGEGEYRYLAAPLPGRSTNCAMPSTRTFSRSPGTGTPSLGDQLPGPRRSTSGLKSAIGPGKQSPRPLILKYGPGDWNALHRDLYGDLVFPLQVVINLTEPGKDHTGGEFLLVEQRPRAQSRGTSTTLPYLQGLVFTTRDRPIQTQRGWSAAPVRHGVSILRSGRRYSLGILLHDAP